MISHLLLSELQRHELAAGAGDTVQMLPLCLSLTALIILFATLQGLSPSWQVSALPSVAGMLVVKGWFFAADTICGPCPLVHVKRTPILFKHPCACGQKHDGYQLFVAISPALTLRDTGYKAWEGILTSKIKGRHPNPNRKEQDKRLHFCPYPLPPCFRCSEPLLLFVTTRM